MELVATELSQLLDFLHRQLVDFFRFSGLVELVRSGQQPDLLKWEWIRSVLLPIVPVLLVLEMLHALVSKKSRLVDFKAPLLTEVFNRLLSVVLSFFAIGAVIALFSRYALFTTDFTWYWFIYGYVVYEFAHFIYHWSCHKVRLLWCLHATHHAPEAMNMSVAYAHLFLEAPFANFLRAAICLLLGVNPEVFLVIWIFDLFWGQFIHIGAAILPNGRLGFLHRIMLTPSHHRVHHGRNPLYIDTNYCNLLPIWDRLFRTYQEEQDDVPIDYGITRNIDSTSFLQVNFAEIIALAQAVWSAPGLGNKLLYMVMPPGWSHTGEHRTASIVKQRYFDEKLAAAPSGG